MLESELPAKLAAKFGESLIVGAVLGTVGGTLRAIFAKGVDIKTRILYVTGGAATGALAFMVAAGFDLSEGMRAGISIGAALAARELVELLPKLVERHGEEMAVGLVKKVTGNGVAKPAAKKRAPAKKRSSSL
jgi:hypothetical protein